MVEVSVSLPLTVRDLTRADLAECTWAGTPTHLGYVAQALDRVPDGDVEYLAACGPAGLPVALIGIDYAVVAGAGRLWQLVVHPALRSCGIGAYLIRTAESRVAGRGLGVAELGVEEANARARKLYERLGYVARASEPESWLVEEPDGSMRRHHTVCTVMCRRLK